MLGIIDYGSGNIYSFQNIFNSLDIQHLIIKSSDDVSKCSHIILPGVGDFDETIGLLQAKGYIESLEEHILKKGSYFLGVCVGMQILGDSSEEGILDGLGWIPGKVKKIKKTNKNIRLPHMGWNSLSINNHSPLTYDIDIDAGAYFLHNYEFIPELNDCIIATSDYGKPIASIINKNNIFGVQFHPEKSHDNGVKLLKNFSQL